MNHLSLAALIFTLTFSLNSFSMADDFDDKNSDDCWDALIDSDPSPSEIESWGDVSDQTLSDMGFSEYRWDSLGEPNDEDEAELFLRKAEAEQLPIKENRQKVRQENNDAKIREELGLAPTDKDLHNLALEYLELDSVAKRNLKIKEMLTQLERLAYAVYYREKFFISAHALGQDREDLIQAAISSVTKTLEKFDPQKGRFSTLSYHHMKGAMHREVDRMRIGKKNKMLRKQLEHFAELQNQFFKQYGSPPTGEDYLRLLSEANLTVGDLNQLKTYSLDESMGTDGRLTYLDNIRGDHRTEEQVQIDQQVESEINLIQEVVKAIALYNPQIAKGYYAYAVEQELPEFNIEVKVVVFGKPRLLPYGHIKHIATIMDFAANESRRLEKTKKVIELIDKFLKVCRNDENFFSKNGILEKFRDNMPKKDQRLSVFLAHLKSF